MRHLLGRQSPMPASRPHPVAQWVTFLGGLAVLLLGTFPASGLPARLTPQDLTIQVTANHLQGALPSGQGLTILLLVPDHASGQDGQLVAVFDSPSFSQQMSPLLPDSDSRRLSATIDLGPLFGSLGTPPRALPIHISVARQRGMHVEELARRTFYVTVGVPGSPDHRISFSAADLAQVYGEPSDPHHDSGSEVLLDGPIEEQDLLPNSPLAQQQGYWKMVNRLIRHRLRQELTSARGLRTRRGPSVRFQLFANGEAQLIELERSSGDADLDQAAVLAVVNAHPFPPFPRGVSETHIDVHVDLPVPKR